MLLRGWAYSPKTDVDPCINDLSIETRLAFKFPFFRTILVSTMAWASKHKLSFPENLTTTSCTTRPTPTRSPLSPPSYTTDSFFRNPQKRHVSSLQTYITLLHLVSPPHTLSLSRFFVTSFVPLKNYWLPSPLQAELLPVPSTFPIVPVPGWEWLVRITRRASISKRRLYEAR